MRAEVRWTHLTCRQIVRRLAERGLAVGVKVVRQLLKRHRYGRRKAVKTAEMGPRHPRRDDQFRRIAALREEFLAAGAPVVSVDAKKRELVGNFFRAGTVYAKEPIRTYDHDFPSHAKGVVVPYGVYDVVANLGYVNLGTSKDTSEFACDSLEWWWREHGRRRYPKAKAVLVLCDGGGSNSASRHVFKEQLQKLADRTGIEFRVAHYPPYCSKYNPIEHRMFPHVTRACQGVVFESVALVKRLVESTATDAGLAVVAKVADKVYEAGKKCAAGFKKAMKIIFDELLPKWNYRAVPQPAPP
jgi:hypothetical protein